MAAMYLGDGPSGAITREDDGHYWYSGVPFDSMEDVQAAIERQKATGPRPSQEYTTQQWPPEGEAPRAPRWRVREEQPWALRLQQAQESDRGPYHMYGEPPGNSLPSL